MCELCLFRLAIMHLQDAVRFNARPKLRQAITSGLRFEQVAIRVGLKSIDMACRYCRSYRKNAWRAIPVPSRCQPDANDSCVIHEG